MPANHALAAKLLGIAGALAACALLAACGGSSASDPASSTASRYEAALKFSKCMREHGIKDFPDPETFEGHVQLRVHSGAGGVEASPRVMEGAQKACQHYQEAMAPKLTPQEKVQREEAVQKFARCMREHGIHVETPSSGGAIAIKVHQSSRQGGGEGGPNPESPGFQKAQEACFKLLPGGGPKGGVPRARRLRNGSGGGPESQSESAFSTK